MKIRIQEILKKTCYFIILRINRIKCKKNIQQQQQQQQQQQYYYYYHQEELKNLKLNENINQELQNINQNLKLQNKKQNYLDQKVKRMLLADETTLIIIYYFNVIQQISYQILQSYISIYYIRNTKFTGLKPSQRTILKQETVKQNFKLPSSQGTFITPKLFVINEYNKYSNNPF
ncbi:unnamed protein product [Paramecium sonneborni]|uniref:Uncharacterized protein n=1 Tax=Paramecium sonneborni TaxID=65129 RepID=A0A8S1RNT8_9CILI|nr:unnamed protein product [Paramecium sonneborni]